MHPRLQVLRQEGIRFVVAPYEADAQLAYLMQAGTIQGVITEDSDTIPYGCDNVLYKMDKAGNGQLFRRNALGSVPAGKVKPLLPSDMSDEQVCLPPTRASNIYTHTHFLLQLLCWCILCGCDYLPSLHGVGSKVALKRLLDAKRWLRGNFTPKQLMSRLRYHAMQGWGTQYEEGFLRAHQTFRHHRVYCPEAKRVRCLQPLPVSAWQVHYDAAVSAGSAPASELARWVKHGYHWPAGACKALDFVGPLLDPAIAQGIAEGYLHPETHEKFSSSIPGQVGALSSGEGAAGGDGGRATKQATQTRLTGLFAKQARSAPDTDAIRARQGSAAHSGSRSFSSAAADPAGTGAGWGDEQAYQSEAADSVTAAVQERQNIRKRIRPLAEEQLLGRVEQHAAGAASKFFPAVHSDTAPPPCSPLQGPITKRPAIASATSPSPSIGSNFLTSFLYDPSPAKVQPLQAHTPPVAPTAAAPGLQPQGSSNVAVGLAATGNYAFDPLQAASTAPQPQGANTASAGKGRVSGRAGGGVSATAKRLLQRSQMKGSCANESAVRKQVSQMHSCADSSHPPMATPQPAAARAVDGLAGLSAFAYTGSEPSKAASAASTQPSVTGTGAFSYSPLQPSTGFNRGVLSSVPRLADAMGAAKALVFEDSREDSQVVRRRPGAGLRRPA